ncbi:hypothetical protein LCER1_G009431, partial [Lachnellula cervina]
MLLLDIPAEIVSKILVYAVLARGIKRALRLRLVCKQFSQDIQHAVFESRLLDYVNTEKVLCDRYIENDHGASRFWHSYIVYRVQNENLKPAPQPAQRRYRDIGLVAKRIWEETGADMEATIETLCWPALQQAMTPGIVPEMYYNTEQQPDLALLCAAAYLNLIPIAKRLLQVGHSPHKESNTFSSPMKLAAWAGNAQMLEIFQDHVPEMDGLGHIPIELVFDDGWRGKTGPASINGAVLRGDIAMVRLAVYPPSRAAPD